MWQIAIPAAAVVACLLVCGLAAFWLWRVFVGEPPGRGDRAQLGYDTCAPIIAALARYHQAQGKYPTELVELVPTYLAELPLSVNGYPIHYEPSRDSYSLEFSYEGPGMNRCTYSPQLQWRCYGYY